MFGSEGVKTLLPHRVAMIVMKKILPYIIIGIVFMLGMLLIFYPDISNWLNERGQSTAIQKYDDAVAVAEAERLEAEFEKAKEYNDALVGVKVVDPFIPGSGTVIPDNYMSILNMGGIMGYIKIPSINVSLPIYHGTSEDVLKRGAGHLELSAFPIGGEGNHSVITGHTGLTSARLFTDLIEMRIGDRFYIQVLGTVLAYEVNQVLVVDPEDTEDLRPMQGKDYVTLITCTPYAINSHRLLVRGERVEYIEESISSMGSTTGSTTDWYREAIIALAFFLIICFVIFRCLKTKRLKKQTDRKSSPSQ